MSKFRPLADFEAPLASGYKLLPFRFTLLEGDEYILTNEAGEFHVVERGELDALVKHRLEHSHPVYNDLKSKHFLIDDDSNIAVDLLALKIRTKLRRISNFTGLHIFVVSLRCDHSCPYCQVSRQSDDRRAFDMSEQTAMRALDLTFRSPSEALKIEFQGGEPLLNFDLIKLLVIAAEKRNEIEHRNLQFVITTNLALITDEILHFCRDHDVLISTSLDGPRELHNGNRKRPGLDAYERTVAGIKRCREILGKDKVGALMTTTEASLRQPRAIIDEYVAQGFDSIFLRPISPYGFAVKTDSYSAYDAERFLQFYFEALNYILEINYSGTFLAENFATIALTKMLTPYFPGFVNLRTPDGMGIGAVVYNYDGGVYASDESRMLAEMGDRTFWLGDVHKNNYDEIFLSEALLEPLEQSFSASVPMCADCAFQPYCGSEPIFHYRVDRDFVGFKPNSPFCVRNMGIFKRLIKLYRSNSSARRVFNNWVAGAC